MSATEDKELHSRSSIDSSHRDLEKGESAPTKDEEEVVHEEVKDKSTFLTCWSISKT